MSQESQKPELFQVQSILARRKIGRKYEYKIKWKGFSESEATWQPLRNLKDLEEVIQKYQKDIEKMPQANSINQTLQHEPQESLESSQREHQETMLEIDIHRNNGQRNTFVSQEKVGLAIQKSSESQQKCQQQSQHRNYMLKKHHHLLNDTFTLGPLKNSEFTASQQPRQVQTQQPAFQSHSIDLQLQSKKLHKNLSNLAAKIGHRFPDPQPISKRTRKRQKIESKQKKNSIKNERLNKTCDLQPKKNNQADKKKGVHKKSNQNEKNIKKTQRDDFERQYNQKLTSRIWPKIQDNLQHLPTALSNHTEAKNDCRRQILSVRGLEKNQLAQAECLVAYNDKSLQVMTLSQLSRQYPQEVLRYLSKNVNLVYP